MENILAEFISAIHDKRKIRLTFYSKQDKSVIERLTAPLDYGPSSKSKNKDNRFHFWDYQSDTQNHTLSLLPNQIIGMEFMNENFDSTDFMSWIPNWTIERNWG